ncbi:MAG: cell envelope integrity protein TolA [Hyphomicrobium sp.]|nr:cell envelope integrity protein TolA [Hyphomicrobium sp.]
MPRPKKIPMMQDKGSGLPIAPDDPENLLPPATAGAPMPAMESFNTPVKNSPSPAAVAIVSPRRGGTFWSVPKLFGLAGSLLIHSAVLAALYDWLDDAPGAISEPTVAISIAHQATEVLEAIDASDEASAAAASSVSASAGEPELVTAQSATEEIQSDAKAVDVAAREPDAPEAKPGGSVSPVDELPSVVARDVAADTPPPEQVQTVTATQAEPAASPSEPEPASATQLPPSSTSDLDVLKGAMETGEPTVAATEERKASTGEAEPKPARDLRARERQKRWNEQKRAEQARSAQQEQDRKERAERAERAQRVETAARRESEDKERRAAAERERAAKAQADKQQRADRAARTAARKQKSEASAKKGGAASQASRGSKGSSGGKVSASRGSAINYAAMVRARVAGNRPSGGGRRGTVVVSFGVSSSGGLSFASISRSSGDAALDRSALSAVRGAGPFPPPPPGASRRFSIPFSFR